MMTTTDQNGATAVTSTEVSASDLREFIVEEQSTLWGELDDALRRAINGVWSMDASNVARRIVAAARLVGPTDYGAVPWRLVSGDVYDAVLTAGGVEHRLPDAAQWAHDEELMAARSGNRATNQQHYARTVAQIKTTRETAWINGEDE